MSRQNIEAVHRLLAAITERDLSRMFELSDPNIEWRSFFAELAEGGGYRGHEGMRRYLTDLSEAFDALSVEVGDLLDVGETIVGIGRIQYRGRGGGVESDAPAGWVFRFRDGKVAYFHAFRDPERVFGSVGLSDG
ncbi:MAG: nuclear transport factor 2 family protein [Actinomycetota bacterium]|nr:nuclear transport factor 2 family protein [Actinomycetota bacterium]